VNGFVPAATTSAADQSPRDADFNLIDRARSLFEQAFPAERIAATWRHGNRAFTIHDHLGFILLALYVPTTDTLRRLCKASELELFKQRYRCLTMDLGSVSKAQAHVPEELLLPIIDQLTKEVRTQARQMAGNGNASSPVTLRSDAATLGKYALRVVDSSVFRCIAENDMGFVRGGQEKERRQENRFRPLPRRLRSLRPLSSRLRGDIGGSR